MDPLSDSEAGAAVEAALCTLEAHFDAVQIIASRHDAGAEQVLIVDRGSGNVFTRFGQLTAWLEREKERMRRSGGY